MKLPNTEKELFCLMQVYWKRQHEYPHWRVPWAQISYSTLALEFGQEPTLVRRESR